MTKLASFIGPVLIILATGCDSKAPNVTQSVGGGNLPVANSTHSNPTSAGSLKTPTGSVPSGVDSAKPIDLSALPSDLKNDGYDYFGLDGKTVGLQFVNSVNGTISTGSTTAKLIKVQGDKATFEIKRTGQFGDLVGNDTVELTPSGVFDISTSKGTLKSKTLELPAKIQPGTSWKYDVDLQTSSGDIKQNFVQTAVRVQSLKTPDGTLNVLYVKGQGTESINNQSFKSETKSYYAKGLGMVQFEERIVKKSGKTLTFTIKMLPKGA